MRLKWLCQREAASQEDRRNQKARLLPLPPELSPLGRQTALLTPVLVNMFTAEADLTSLILEMG